MKGSCRCLAAIMCTASFGAIGAARAQDALAMDTQGGALPLTLPFDSGVIDVSAATADASDPFFRGEVKTVWLAYTATADGPIRIDLDGVFEHVLFAFVAPAPDGALAEPDAIAVAYDSLVLPMTAGTSYLVMVGNVGASDQIHLIADAVTLPPPPPNDDLANATLVEALPFADAIDGGGATRNPSDPDFSSLFPTVWYHLDASANETVLVDAADGAIGITVYAADGTMIAQGVQQLTFDAQAGRGYDIQFLFQRAPGPLSVSFSAQASDPSGGGGGDTLTNDERGGALPVVLPYDSGLLDISAATGAATDPFVHGDAPSVWFAYTAPADGPVRFDVASDDGIQHILIAFNAPAPGVEPSEADAVAAGYDALILHGISGSSYLIVVLTLGPPGLIDLTADATTLPAAPDNDNKSSATPITSVPFADSIDVSGATSDPSDPGPGALFPTVWYHFQTSASQQVTFDTLGSMPGLQILVLDADGNILAAETDRVTFDATGGTGYDILVIFPAPPAWLEVAVTGSSAPAPSNDEIRGSEIIFNTPYDRTLGVAGATANPTDPPESEGRPTVWYGMLAQIDGRLTFDTSYTDTSVDLVLYEIDDPASVFSVDRLHFLARARNHLSWNATARHGYVLMAMPNAAARLRLMVDLTEVMPPPVNDDIANAIVIDPATLPLGYVIDTRGSQLGDDAGLLPSGDGTSIWFRVTTQGPLPLVLGAAGTSFPISMRLYDGYPSATTPSSERGYTTYAPLAAGRTYYIAMHGPHVGQVMLSASIAPFAANDEPAGALPIPSLPYQASVGNSGLTPGADDPAIPGSQWPLPPATAWYTFTPDHDLELALGSSDNTGNTTLAVLAGGPGAWNLLGMYSPGLAGSSESVQLTGGVTYLIMVANASPDVASFSIAFAEGKSVRGHLSGTVRWGQFVARSGTVTLSGPATLTAPLQLAADGMSGTYSVEVPLAATYSVSTSITDCDSSTDCGWVDWNEPLTVHPGASFTLGSVTCVAASGTDVPCDVVPPPGRGLARACGTFDVGGRGPKAWVQTSFYDPVVQGWEVTTPASDSSYCIHVPQGVTAGLLLGSIPTQCTFEAYYQLANVSFDVPAGVAEVSVPPVSFADGAAGTIDVTSGIADEPLYQTVQVSCTDDDCPGGCNVAGTASASFQGEVGQSHLLATAGDKVVDWLGSNTPLTDDALLAALGGNIASIQDNKQFIEDYLDSLGSVSAYLAQMHVPLAAGETRTVDLSLGATAHLLVPAFNPAPTSGFQVSVGSVVVADERGSEPAYVALGEGLSLHGVQVLMQAEGMGEVPPALLDVDLDVDARPLDLALAVDGDWAIRGALGVVIEIPELVGRFGAEGEDELQTLELRVRMDALGVAGTSFDGLFPFSPFDMTGDLQPGGSLDVPLGPLTEGEVKTFDTPLLRPDVGHLRLHVPEGGNDELVGGYLFFVAERPTGLPGDPTRLEVIMDLRVSAVPFSQLEVGLPEGKHRGIGVAVDSAGNTVGDVFGSIFEMDSMDGNLQVDIAAGDEIDQTPGAPYTHDLEPAPGETCATAIDLRGVVSDPDGVVELLVDGQPVELAADGTFSTPVALAFGPNVVTLEARDAFDEWVKRTRIITRRMPHDTDGDGLTDCEEANLADGGTCPSADKADSDSDGVSDGVEANTCTSPCVADSDNDGLTDGEESVLGTSPCHVDTDADGWSDLVDPDPLDANTNASLFRLLVQLSDTLDATAPNLFVGPNDNARNNRRQMMATLATTAAGCAARGDRSCVRDHVTSLRDHTDGETSVTDWMLKSTATSVVNALCVRILGLVGP